MKNKTIINLLIKKASQVKICKHRIAAIALDKKGNVLGRSTNKPRFIQKGGGKHAEMCLMERYGKKISIIVICRTNSSGRMLPIDPCLNCAKNADRIGIKIISLCAGNGPSNKPRW